MMNRTIERNCLRGFARAVGTFAAGLSAVAGTGMKPQCGRTFVMGGSA